ncbi:MAG: hypothetical protein RL134_1601 [Actinomycetota bacterium]|jgi:hypothetical protein
MTGSRDDARLKNVVAALRTARAAAIGGLVFAALMTIALVLFRGAFPLDQYLDAQAIPTSESLSRARMALFLVPYAGIAFLWFTAALNYHLGHADHALFTTVFISSGVLFVGVIFVAAAFASAELTALDRGIDLTGSSRIIPAVAVNELLVGYSARMAAVFCLSLSTMGRLRRVLPTWLSILGTVTGLFLLLVPFGVQHVEYVFPVWVATISTYLLITDPGGKARAQIGQ